MFDSIYINLFTCRVNNFLFLGRNGNGEVKALLSNQMQTFSVVFGPPGKGGMRSLAKKGAENEQKPQTTEEAMYLHAAKHGVDSRDNVGQRFSIVRSSQSLK